MERFDESEVEGRIKRGEGEVSRRREKEKERGRDKKREDGKKREVE